MDAEPTTVVHDMQLFWSIILHFHSVTQAVMVAVPEVASAVTKLWAESARLQMEEMDREELANA